jgi:Protein of unknown function (DUF2695)
MTTMTTDNPRWNEFAETLSEVLLTGDYGDACMCDHRHAKKVLAEMGDVDIPASLEYFENHGGYCDCEILFNVDRRHEDTDGEPS